MNGATFRLFRTAMGLEVSDISRKLEVNPRTINRWESGVIELPAFADVWMEDRWAAFLDELGDYVEKVDVIPNGVPVRLTTYKTQESLTDAGSALTVEEVDARNNALAVVLGLGDYDVYAEPVEDKETDDGPRGTADQDEPEA